jgi:hypothetical protein
MYCDLIHFYKAEELTMEDKAPRIQQAPADHPRFERNALSLSLQVTTHELSLLTRVKDLSMPPLTKPIVTAFQKLLCSSP